MKELSIQTIADLQEQLGLQTSSSSIFTLPEKVLQFGTGVLLRGLPDYFIDKANKQGIFNGRVVVVKSTSQGGTDAYETQNCLYTHFIRGLEEGKKVEENIVNGSISRVLSASQEWSTILKFATDSSLQIVISNTTEVGIALVKEDKIDADPPVSFPGKLLAVLHARFKAFNGDPSKGLVIIPTELIVDNAKKLRSILLELAALNKAENAFIEWVKNCNHFCNSLVDRIVPGKLPASEKETFETEFGYHDDLMIMSESYSLWAVETGNETVKEILSFYKAGAGVVIADDINKFRELKLRLLNGAHTLTCALAHIAGCTTVKEAMDDEMIAAYVASLMLGEIAPAITTPNLPFDEATAFAQKVMDRFRNPFIEHRWLSISVQYSSKMKMRILPVLIKHYENHGTVPSLVAAGFAAYILFMKCRKEHDSFVGSAGGKEYSIQDEHAGWFAERAELEGRELVQAVLTNTEFWQTDLSKLPGFPEAVLNNYDQLAKGEVKRLISDCLNCHSL